MRREGARDGLGDGSGARPRSKASAYRGSRGVSAWGLRRLDDDDASAHHLLGVGKRAGCLELALKCTSLGGVAPGHQLDDECSQLVAGQRTLEVRNVFLDELVDFVREVLDRTPVWQELIAHALDLTVVIARLVEQSSVALQSFQLLPHCCAVIRVGVAGDRMTSQHLFEPQWCVGPYCRNQ